MRLWQALSYCDEQSHAMHRNYYQHRIWQKLAYGRALAATGGVVAARASLEQAGPPSTHGLFDFYFLSTIIPIVIPI